MATVHGNLITFLIYFVASALKSFQRKKVYNGRNPKIMMAKVGHVECLPSSAVCTQQGRTTGELGHWCSRFTDARGEVSSRGPVLQRSLSVVRAACCICIMEDSGALITLDQV